MVGFRNGVDIVGRVGLTGKVKRSCVVCSVGKVESCEGNDTFVGVGRGGKVNRPWEERFSPFWRRKVVEIEGGVSLVTGRGWVGRVKVGNLCVTVEIESVPMLETGGLWVVERF